MRRRIIEFILFFYTGIFLVAALTYSQPDKNDPPMLVDIQTDIPIFATDTTLIYDTNFDPIGKLYPTGVVYLKKPFVIKSHKIYTRVYAWVYYESIFNLGKDWLLIKDENIRVKNNCAKIGRLNKNTRLHKIYSPEDGAWNLFALDCFLEIQGMRSYVDSMYQSIFSNRWPIVITTDLTTDGCKYPNRRITPDIKLPDFFNLFPVVISLVDLWFYFRKTGRLHCNDRWVLLIIDIAGFATGVTLGMIL